MARISYTVLGQSSVNLSVVELNQNSSYSSIYITCNGRTSPNLAKSGYNSSSNIWYLSGLSPGTTYYASFTIRSSTGNTASGGTSFTTEGAPVPPPDTTPPVISYQGHSGLGKLSLSWSAYDTGDGLRSYNRYQLYIGTRDGGSGTLSTSGYTDSTYNEWYRDANGNGLIANSYYWVGVRAYDVRGNSALLTQQIQYRTARPNNWSWDTSKTSGSNFNLTASEWNRFTDRINQFRLYKGYSAYSFTTVYTGNPVYAYQINEAIIGMRAMVTPPASVSSGSTAYASFLYSLSNALNSIY